MPAATEPSRRGRSPGIWRRRMALWLGVLVLIYAAWCGLLYFKQDSMMFPRHLTGPAEAGPPPGVECLWIEADDGGAALQSGRGANSLKTGRVEAWFFPPPVTGRDAPLLVFFHGSGELIDHGLALAEAWRERGYAVLLPEYRGYGRSSGTPSQRHIVADALRFIEAAAARDGIDLSRTVLHGRSLGGAVAAQVAAKLSPPPAAVIVESGFPSAAAFATRFLAPPLLVKNPFHTADALATFGGPVLLLHGREDEIIPAREGRRLHDLVPGSLYHELAGGHNDFPAEPEQYWRVIEAFLTRLIPR